MASGQWRDSRRRDSLPPDWPETRKRILRRDGYRCTASTAYGRCTETATDVDHVTPAWRGGGDEDENLTSLCKPHHAQKSAREGVEAKQARRLAAMRPPERHPGRIV